MTAIQWVDFLTNHGVDIRITNSGGLIGKSGGGYLWVSDEILYAFKLNKETVFHELAHWTGNKLRLHRDDDEAANDLEESIAWETTRLMVKRFGGGSWHYYHHAPKHSMRNSFEAKWFGRQAFEFICHEFNL